MSKRPKNFKSGSKFQKKKLPFAKRKIDDAQNKRIVKVEQKVTALAKQSELKHRDILVDNVAADDTPTDTTQMILLNGIPQEDDAPTKTTREGDQVRLTSLQIRGTWDLNQLTNVGTYVRIIIFWDTMPKGVAPTATELLDVSTITRYILAPYHYDNIKRFNIIYDKLNYMFPQVQATQSDTNLAGGGGANTITTTLFGSQRKPFKIYKKINKQIYMGLDDTGNVSAIQTPALYMLFFSSTPVGSNPPNITFGCRIYFKDT